MDELLNRLLVYMDAHDPFTEDMPVGLIASISARRGACMRVQYSFSLALHTHVDANDALREIHNWLEERGA